MAYTVPFVPNSSAMVNVGLTQGSIIVCPGGGSLMGVEFYASIAHDTAANMPCLYSCVGNVPKALLRTGDSIAGVTPGLNSLHFSTPYTPLTDELLFAGIYTEVADWSSAATNDMPRWHWTGPPTSDAPTAIQQLPGLSIPHIWPKMSANKLVTLSGASADVLLTKGNLVASKVGTANGVGVRSKTVKTVGKLYFETAVTLTNGNNDAVGLLQADGTYYQMAVEGSHCTQVVKWNGSIWSNNINTGRTVGPVATGDILRIAADLPARKAWVARNNGLWNGLSAASCDPAAGTGAVQMAPDVAFGPAVVFGGAGTASGAIMTANFGATPYAFPAPAGFGNWMV